MSIKRVHPHVLLTDSGDVVCYSVQLAPRMCSAVSLMKSNQHLWAKILTGPAFKMGR